MMQKLRRHAVAAVGLDRPAARRLVEGGGGHPRVEAGCRGAGRSGRRRGWRSAGSRAGRRSARVHSHSCCSSSRERVGVLHALDVAARAGVAVPVPGAADAAARLEHPRREPEPPQPVQHVQAGEAGADDDRVEHHGRLLVHRHDVGPLGHEGHAGIPLARHALGDRGVEIVDPLHPGQAALVRVQPVGVEPHAADAHRLELHLGLPLVDSA